jgi:hypothetical protein
LSLIVGVEQPDQGEIWMPRGLQPWCGRAVRAAALAGKNLRAGCA